MQKRYAMYVLNFPKILLFIFLGYTISWGNTAYAGDKVIKEMEGHYSVPAKYCSELDDGVMVSCANHVRDCLSIKKIDENSAQIYIDSTQANGNQCGTSGVATVQGNALILTGTEQDISSNGKKISIELINGKIKIRYLNHDDHNFGEAPPFCGLRARLDQLEFDLKYKSSSGKSCTSE